MSGESLLEAREEVNRRKEGVCQEDTGVKGVHFLNWLFPDTCKLPASILCDQFSVNPWNLSSSGGVCTTTYLNLIKSTAKLGQAR